MELKPARPKDLDNVWRLYSLATDHLVKTGIDQWDALYPDVSMIREDIKSGCLYLLSDGGMLLSAVVLNDHQEAPYGLVEWKYTGGRILTVHRLCVSPSRQGQGIGKRTMQLAEGLARQKGFTGLRLDAFYNNPAANALYETLGYIKAGSVTIRKGLFHCYEKQL